MKSTLLLVLLGTAGLLLADEPNLDHLLVSGRGFSFGVRVPDGWTGDTEARALKYKANVFYFPTSSPGKSDSPSIRVRIAPKTDEEVEKDLEADMASYKKAKPKVEFLDVDISHPKYRTACKLFWQRRKFSEYVCYLTPGPEFAYILSVALSPASREATPEELESFRQVLESLVAIPAQ